MTDESEFRIVQKLRRLSTSQVSDALDSLGLVGAVVGILPIYRPVKIVGPAVTVKKVDQTHGESSFRRSEILEYAKRGDVLAIGSSGRIDASNWGSLASFTAKVKRIEGVVIDGACRDAEEIRRMKFPVFCRGVVPVSGRGRMAIESVNESLKLGEVLVSPGDFVVGDESGVVVVQRKRADEVLIAAQTISREERKIKSLIPRYASLTLAREAVIRSAGQPRAP